MFENIGKLVKKVLNIENNKENASGKEAKERLHLVLMQDRANVSADFLEMMKQEIIEVIKKYIDVDENAIDVRLTNQSNEDGSNGAPALYANIPIINIKENSEEEKSDKEVETKKVAKKGTKKDAKKPQKASKSKSNEKVANKKTESKSDSKKETSKKEQEPKKEQEKKEQDKVKNKEDSQEKKKSSNKEETKE